MMKGNKPCLSGVAGASNLPYSTPTADGQQKKKFISGTASVLQQNSKAKFQGPEHCLANGSAPQVRTGPLHQIHQGAAKNIGGMDPVSEELAESDYEDVEKEEEEKTERLAENSCACQGITKDKEGDEEEISRL